MGFLSSLIGCFKNKSKFDNEISKSIQEFNNRTIYKELTKEIIDNTPDEKLLQTIFDNIETVFDDGEIYTVERIKNLSPGKKAIFSIWILEAEVNNGGFNQFYYNSSGNFSELAFEGLILIGATSTADILQRANTIYKNIEEDLRNNDDGTIESFSESYENNPLNAFDDEFYNNEEKLLEIQINYIRENINQFIN